MINAARSYARSLGLKREKEWRVFTKSGKLPVDVPAYPPQTYRDKGWVSWGDWLGTGTVAARLRVYRIFTEARSYARSLWLKRQKEWNVFTKSGKLPDDIPAAPDQVYRDKGWSGMGDWLGTGKIRRRAFRPFKEARAYARSLGLKTEREWRVFTKSGKLPDDIPAAPRNTYRGKGWKGTKDWLGTG